LKILYDHQIFSQQKYGGISRYFSELMKYYYQTGDVKFDLSLKYSENFYLKNAPYSNHKNFFIKSSFKGKDTLLTKINEKNSGTALIKGNFNLFHPTYYDTYFLKYIKNKPFVLTVYDMIYEVFPNEFKKSDSLKKNKELLIKKSEKILAISNNTKKDLLKYYDIDSEKIRVTYLANPLQSKLILNNLNLPENYILFVGNRGIYKNFLHFINEIRDVLIHDHKLFVVCGGGGNFSKEELEEFKKLNIGNQILYRQIDDDRLFNLYKNAKLFIFPSLYEGFGLPVLESYYSGCPTLLSNRSSLPEIGGDAAMYFDPKKPFSIRECVEKVLNNDELRKKLITKGYKQLENYSWEKTAKSTLDIYRESIC